MPIGSVDSVGSVATGIIVSVRWCGSVFGVIELDGNLFSSRSATPGKRVLIEGAILTHNDYLI